MVPETSPLDPHRAAIAAAKLVVAKVGTRVLTFPDGRLDPDRIASLATQLAEVVRSGKQIVLISSGAVGAGIGRLKLGARPTDLASLQAVAAVGQSCLIEAYNRELEKHGQYAAQVLLTGDDFSDRVRYLNVRNTLFALFRLGAIPIINENDTVRVDELQRNVGDNDRLAAMVTNLLRAPVLLLLSDVDGVWRPGTEGGNREVLPVVDLSQVASSALVDGAVHQGPQLSVGGMGSKLESASVACVSGQRVVIASGRRPNVIVDLLAGQPIGTVVVGSDAKLNSRKRWLGWATRPLGRLTVDAGAVRAITEKGRSLLPVGVRGVEGNFSHGDVVAVVDETGREVARGLTNYGTDELRTIAGAAGDRISELIGHYPYEEVVHRDHLVLVGKKSAS